MITFATSPARDGARWYRHFRYLLSHKPARSHDAFSKAQASLVRHSSQQAKFICLGLEQPTTNEVDDLALRPASPALVDPRARSRP